MTDEWTLKGKEFEPYESGITRYVFSKEDIETLRQKIIERMEKIFFINILPKDAPLTLSQQAYIKGMFGSMLNSINLLFGDPQPNITHLEKYGSWSNYWTELNKRFGVEE